MNNVNQDLLSVTNEWKFHDCTGDVPLSRSQHSAVVFDEKLVIFGGRSKNFFFNDTIVLDPGTVAQWTL